MAWSALKQLRLTQPAKTIVEFDKAEPWRPTTLTIEDYIDKLPWHPTRIWAKRTINQISEIIVHQAAAKGATAESVNNYHITPSLDRNNDGIIEAWERNHISPDGAPHICYHYVIESDGTVKQVNPLTAVTWHAKGHNTKAIGILVAGYFSGPGHENAGTPTRAQQNSLMALIDYLHQQFPKIPKTNYLGHCEVDPINKPACPGYILMNDLTHWRNL